MAVCESPRWQTQADAEVRSLQLDSEGCTETPHTLTSTPVKPGYVCLHRLDNMRRMPFRLPALTLRLLCLQLGLMAQCSGSIKHIRRVSLILDGDDDEQPEELGLTGLTASDKQSGETRFVHSVAATNVPITGQVETPSEQKHGSIVGHNSGHRGCV